MQILTPEEQQILQGELSQGESILWTGRPNPRVIFHASDWMMIPFSLLWGGFAIFWEAGVTGNFGMSHNKQSPLFFVIWGIPFVLIGQFFIWGRFFYAAWRKKRLFYAITDKRVLVIARPPRPKTIAAFINTLPSIDKAIRSDGIGTLKFGYTGELQMNRKSQDMSGLFLNVGFPVFADIDDAEIAHSIVTNQRNRA